MKDTASSVEETKTVEGSIPSQQEIKSLEGQDEDKRNYIRHFVGFVEEVSGKFLQFNLFQNKATGQLNACGWVGDERTYFHDLDGLVAQFKWSKEEAQKITDKIMKLANTRAK